MQGICLPPSSQERIDEQSENRTKYPSKTGKITTGSKNLASQEISHSEETLEKIIFTRDKKESSASEVNQSYDQNLSKAKTKRNKKIVYTETDEQLSAHKACIIMLEEQNRDYENKITLLQRKLNSNNIASESKVSEGSTNVVKALKTGKSPGPDGLSAEHFKLMPEELLTYIVNIVNLIFKDKDLPQETKEGVVFSEGILKDRLEPKLLKIQSKLQKGFTEKTSSLNTAFIVSAAADFYKEILEELILLTLDAQKAFDKLHHKILFNKMYHDGIVGNMWLLLRNMYRNVTVKVKWNNSISDKFTQEIGVRQGAKLSTVLYKRYNNNILEALERSNIGAQIGNINVVAPTCADDIAILASKEHEVQALLDIVHDMTNKDFVSINPTKSEIVQTAVNKSSTRTKCLSRKQ
ncbi:unnamed protein product [Mytilus coruscus]|uniref:Reverse transcriptase domain-containing protein n=1 Tax=Mytilus coruscus TaxID=42192 RepID=A0A6J8BXN9_MYTCO|nr:unnamed protein product [Mytilus coruscus]